MECLCGGIRRRGSFEIGRPVSRRWKNFGRRWTRGLGVLENWTIFMDVICVSSLMPLSTLVSLKSYSWKDLRCYLNLRPNNGVLKWLLLCYVINKICLSVMNLLKLYSCVPIIWVVQLPWTLGFLVDSETLDLVETLTEH